MAVSIPDASSRTCVVGGDRVALTTRLKLPSAPMNRRGIIAAASAAALVPMADAARAIRPNRLKPQVDDVLVHSFGTNAGIAVTPADLTGERVFAFPQAPDGVVRDGSLHNQLAIVRLDESAMTDATRQHAAGPFVAYSAACTHTGCQVSGWLAEERYLVCPCHGSQFDSHDAARVAIGPAPKPLAMLPIILEGDQFRVTGPFSRRVGAEPL